MNLRLVILMIATCLAAGLARAGPPEIPPAPGTGIADLAGAITDNDEASLRALIVEARSGGVRLAILTLRTTGGEDCQALATRAARAWRLGSVDRDNGLLILLALDDHHWAIKPGIGLEGILGKDLIERIAAEQLTPRLREDQVGRAVIDTACGLLARVMLSTGADMPIVKRWADERNRPGTVAFSPSDAKAGRVVNSVDQDQAPTGQLGVMATTGAAVVGLLLLAMILAAAGRRRSEPHGPGRRPPVNAAAAGHIGSGHDGIGAMLGGVAASTAMMATSDATDVHAAGLRAPASDSGSASAAGDTGSSAGFDSGGAFSDSSGASGSW